MMAEERDQERRPFGLLAVRRRAEKAADDEIWRERFESMVSKAHEQASLAAGEESGPMLESASGAISRLTHTDPNVRRAAIYFVCHRWGMADECLDQIMQLASKDPDPDVRQSAIKKISLFYSASKDKQIAHLLAGIVANDSDPLQVRQYAYSSMRCVLEMNPIPHGLPDQLKIPEQVDWELISACLRREPISVADDDLPILQRLQKKYPELHHRVQLSKEAEMAFNSGNYADSIRLYTMYLEETPRVHDALCMRGCAHGSLGNLAAAIADFSAAIQSGHNSSAATERNRRSDRYLPIYYRERAQAYLYKDLHDLAEADLRTAHKLEQEIKQV